MKIWIVMTEQHYASNVHVQGVYDSREKAEAAQRWYTDFTGQQRTDEKIYETEMNESYPTV